MSERNRLIITAFPVYMFVVCNSLVNLRARCKAGVGPSEHQGEIMACFRLVIEPQPIVLGTEMQQKDDS